MVRGRQQAARAGRQPTEPVRACVAAVCGAAAAPRPGLRACQRWVPSAASRAPLRLPPVRSATNAKLDWTKLNDCWTGAQGAKLEAEAAAATPAHDYVPWATVNGVNHCSDSNCDTILQYVCAAYTGTAPAACTAAMSGKASVLRGAH